ncbi:MAG: CvpA family protein [Pseudomonadota bacterium]|nr:CvpA family protein [Pseudomonadota bacterium]
MPEISLSALTLFDYAVIIILIISAIFSKLRGMTREFLGLAGWFVAIFISRLTAASVQEWLSSFIAVNGLTDVLSWALPFAGTAVIWFIFASLISPGLKRAGLGTLDTWLGVIFGLIRGALLVTLFYVASVLFVQSEDKLYPFMKDSQSSPYIRMITSGFTPFLPADWQSRLSVMNLDMSLTEDTADAVEGQVKQLDENLQLRDDER